MGNRKLLKIRRKAIELRNMYENVYDDVYVYGWIDAIDDILFAIDEELDK